MVKRKYIKPLRSSKTQILNSLRSAKYFIKYSLDTNTRELMKKIIKEFKKGTDSKKIYSKNNIYLPSRLKVHNNIIRNYLRKDKKTKYPDCYVFGGVGGSGKTSVLSKFVREKAITINNDDIKKQLTKYDPSPIKKYPLIHAAFLHRESSDIETELVKKAIEQKKDIILDRTLANYIKNKQLLVGIHKKGYKITILGTNLPPHIALIRVAARFIKNGRYVPLEIIATKGNKTNSSVLRMAKQKFINKSKVFNTTKKKPKLMYQKN